MTRNTAPLPKGTQFVDMWGYPWVNPGGGSTERTAAVFQCNTFRLTFADYDNATGKGYDDPTTVSLAPGHPLGTSSTTLGALRRWTACQVFNYISQTITVPGGPSAPDIYFDVSETDGTGALGFATPFFSSSANPVSFNGGLLNQHIVTGIDPTPNPGDYDAKMTFDFGPNNTWPNNGLNIPINSDAFVANTFGIDLYSVILHEATHALGFFSNMQSNGLSAVTNTSPGLYSLYDRYVLNVSNANLINNTTVAFQGGVAQLTSNQLKYFKSTNTKSYAVYSPAVWKTGSSISHFDAVRDNGEEYVMTAAYNGGARRVYTKPELEVLCNLGYTLTVSLFSCADRYAVGVNDNATTASLINQVSVNVISNDFDPDGQAIALDAASVQLLTNAGSVTTSGNSIVYTPNGIYCGPVIVKYRPYTVANGYSGSYAYLTITISCPNFCPGDPCNLICNGGFETFSQLPTGFQFNYNPSIFPPWRNSEGTPDYFHRNATVPNFSIPVNFFAPAPGVNTHNGGANNAYTASRCVAGNDIEGLSVLLSTPLVAGQQYTLSYWVRAVPYGTGTCTTVNVRTCFLSVPPSYNTNGATSNINGDNLNVVAVPKIPVTAPLNADNNWTFVTTTFTAASNSLYFIAEPQYYPVFGSCGANVKFDDFKLVRAGNQVSTSVTTSNPNPRVGQNVVFTVQVCNTAGTAVNNVTVANTLPAGFSLVSSNFSAYPNHTFAAMPAGACSTLIVTAVAQPTVAFNTDLQNCATITSANSCAQAQSCATVRVLATDISVSAAQQTCSTFRATIANVGTVAAHNVNLSYVPPACFGYSSYTVISGSATYAANQISVPLINPGASVVIEFTGAASIPSNCVNTVALSGAYDEWDLNLTNNAGTVTFGSQLTATITPSAANPQVGQNVTFTVQVCNTAATAANNVSVTNTLPAGLSLVNSTFSAYPNHTFAAIPAGACSTLTVTAQVQSTVAFNTDLQNCATVTAPGSCGTTQGCGTIRVLATDVSVSALPQSCSTFRVTIANLGAVAANNISLSYVPPACFGYISYTVISGAAVYAPNQISITSIAPGGSVVIEFTGSATIPVNCINTISLIGYNEWDLNTSNNTGSVTMGSTSCGPLPCINLPRTQ